MLLSTLRAASVLFFTSSTVNLSSSDLKSCAIVLFLPRVLAN
nr:MAG TPA: hypothetical protein [Caudoviricetes sp.]